jgi:hypothetical protein
MNERLDNSLRDRHNECLALPFQRLFQFLLYPRTVQNTQPPRVTIWTAAFWVKLKSDIHKP